MSGIITDNVGRGTGLMKAAAGGGAWTLISTTTASGSDGINFTTLSTDYKDFLMIGSGITAATNVSFPCIRYYVSGSLVTASEYQWSCRAVDIDNNGGQAMDGWSQDADRIEMADPYDASAVTALGNTAGYNMNFDCIVSDVHSTSLWTQCNFQDTIIQGGSSPSQGVTANYFGGGTHDQAVAVTGLRFYLSAGNIALGTVSLYGRKIS
jgi:hypothetical protein